MLTPPVDRSGDGEAHGDDSREQDVLEVAGSAGPASEQPVVGRRGQVASERRAPLSNVFDRTGAGRTAPGEIRQRIGTRDGHAHQHCRKRRLHKSPVFRPRLPDQPHDRQDQNRGGEEDGVVETRQRLQHHDRAQNDTVPSTPAMQHPRQRPEGQRNRPSPEQFQLGIVGEPVRLKRKDRSGKPCGRLRLRFGPHEEVHRDAAGEKRDQHQEVVLDYGVKTHPHERRAQESGEQERVRIGQRIGLGKEDVSVEEVHRVARQLVGDPREAPGAEEGIVVFSQPGAQREDLRIRQRQGQQGETADDPKPFLSRESIGADGESLRWDGFIG